MREHKWTIAMAFVVSAICCGLLFLLKPDNLHEINLTVLGASATFAALVLPTAELAGQTVVRKTEYWLKRIRDWDTTKKADTKPDLSVLLASLDAIKRKAGGARAASAYVLVSFLTSILSVLKPNLTLLRGWYLHSDYMLTGVSLGFVAVGACVFLPFALSLYHFETLDDVIVYANYVLGSEETLTQSPAVTDPKQPSIGVTTEADSKDSAHAVEQ